MPLYLLSLPETAVFSVCELTPEDAQAIRARLDAASRSSEGGSGDSVGREAPVFEPLQPDDRATVDALIDLWEAARR